MQAPTVAERPTRPREHSEPLRLRRRGNLGSMSALLSHAGAVRHLVQGTTSSALSPPASSSTSVTARQEQAAVVQQVLRANGLAVGQPMPGYKAMFRKPPSPRLRPHAAALTNGGSRPAATAATTSALEAPTAAVVKAQVAATTNGTTSHATLIPTPTAQSSQTPPRSPPTPARMPKSAESTPMSRPSTGSSKRALPRASRRQRALMSGSASPGTPTPRRRGSTSSRRSGRGRSSGDSVASGASTPSRSGRRRTRSRRRSDGGLSVYSATSNETSDADPDTILAGYLTKCNKRRKYWKRR